MENPRSPTVVERLDGETIIKCARCTAGVPCAPAQLKDQTFGNFETSYSEGVEKEEMITYLNENSLPIFETLKYVLGENFEKSKCTACKGKEKLKVSYTPPLPECIRCRGRGFVVQRSKKAKASSKIDTLEKEIEDLEKIVEGKKEKRKQDLEGVLEWFIYIITPTKIEEKSEVRSKSKKIDELEEELDKDTRVLRLENCSYCGGSGVDDNKRTEEGGLLTECQRCEGTGRKITEAVEGDAGGIMTENCDICSSEGVLVVNQEPPFSKCAKCDGFGKTIEKGRKDLISPDTYVYDASTCEICGGLGFTSPDDLETV
jgi:DnaJ-class molecular chaperone